MLFASTPADKAILPTAWGGRYFFNRIGRFLPVVTGRNWPVAAWQGYTPARCNLLLTSRPCSAQGQGCRRHLSCILCMLCFSAIRRSSDAKLGHSVSQFAQFSYISDGRTV
ncbi:hypothetical protein C1896_04775 [Pseudomonadaceae bacterium SI-3]|nr:hypothetical protein C1896_04775 [Pseudomonadaceae bacterium SI-3]